MYRVTKSFTATRDSELSVSVGEHLLLQDNSLATDNSNGVSGWMLMERDENHGEHGLVPRDHIVEMSLEDIKAEHDNIIKLNAKSRTLKARLSERQKAKDQTTRSAGGDSLQDISEVSTAEDSTNRPANQQQKEVDNDRSEEEKQLKQVTDLIGQENTSDEGGVARGVGNGTREQILNHIKSDSEEKVPVSDPMPAQIPTQLLKEGSAVEVQYAGQHQGKRGRIISIMSIPPADEHDHRPPPPSLYEVEYKDGTRESRIKAEFIRLVPPPQPGLRRRARSNSIEQDTGTVSQSSSPTNSLERQTIVCGTVLKLVDPTLDTLENRLPYTVGAGAFAIASSIFDVFRGGSPWAETASTANRDDGAVRQGATASDHMNLVRSEIARLARWVGIQSIQASDEATWANQMSLLARIDVEDTLDESTFALGRREENPGGIRSFSPAVLSTSTLQQEFELRLRGLVRAIEDATEKFQGRVSAAVFQGSLDGMKRRADDLSDWVDVQLARPEYEVEPLRRVPFVMARIYAMRSALDSELFALDSIISTAAKTEFSSMPDPAKFAPGGMDEQMLNLCRQKIGKMVEMVEVEIANVLACVSQRRPSTRMPRRALTPYVLAVELAPVLSRYALMKKILRAQSKFAIPILSASSNTLATAEVSTQIIQGLPKNGDRIVWNDCLDVVRWLFDTSSLSWEPGGRTAILRLSTIEAHRWHMAYLGIVEERSYDMLKHLTVPVVDLIMRLGGGLADIRGTPGPADGRFRIVQALQSVTLPAFADEVRDALTKELCWTDKRNPLPVVLGSAYEMGDHHYFRHEYKNAVQWYERAANESFQGRQRLQDLRRGLACAKLNRLYDLGLGVPISVPDQKEWRKRAFAESASLRGAADVGSDAEAMFFLGRMLLTEEGQGERLTEVQAEATRKGVRLVTLAAQQGLAEAQCTLGALHQHGRAGFHVDETRASELYSFAARQGLVEGQYSLALMKQQRKSTKKEAKQLLEVATSKGFARAQSSLASMHLDDIFDETSFEDYSRPLELFRLAAEQGLAQAHFALGCLYEQGLGVDRDYEEAKRYFLAAADQDLPHAQYRLGYLYEQGFVGHKAGVGEIQHRALAFYTKAADQGYSQAQYALGRHHYIMHPNEPSNAHKLIEAAAEQGLVGAQTTLGVMLVNGTGIEKDVATAAHWFVAAAAQLHAKRNPLLSSPDEEEAAVEACIYLGVMYASGIGFDGVPNPTQAFAYIESAAKANHPAGLHALALLYSSGLGVQRDETQAIQMHHRAVESGSLIAERLDLEKFERCILESFSASALDDDVEALSFVSEKDFLYQKEDGEFVLGGVDLDDDDDGVSMKKRPTLENIDNHEETKSETEKPLESSDGIANKDSAGVITPLAATKTVQPLTEPEPKTTAAASPLKNSSRQGKNKEIRTMPLAEASQENVSGIPDSSARKVDSKRSGEKQKPPKPPKPDSLDISHLTKTAASASGGGVLPGSGRKQKPRAVVAAGAQAQATAPKLSSQKSFDLHAL